MPFRFIQPFALPQRKWKMKNLLILLVVLLFFTLSNKELFAEHKAWSYTMEEMYEMALVYKQVIKGKPPDTTQGDWLMKYIQAGEFRGYVAAILDTTDRFNECAKRIRLNDIVWRTAELLTNIPLNRSSNTCGAMYIAIAFACEEYLVRKQKSDEMKPKATPPETQAD